MLKYFKHLPAGIEAGENESHFIPTLQIVESWSFVGVTGHGEELLDVLYNDSYTYSFMISEPIDKNPKIYLG